MFRRRLPNWTPGPHIRSIAVMLAAGYSVVSLGQAEERGLWDQVLAAESRGYELLDQEQASPTNSPQRRGLRQQRLQAFRQASLLIVAYQRQRRFPYDSTEHLNLAYRAGRYQELAGQFASAQKFYSLCAKHPARGDKLAAELRERIAAVDDALAHQASKGGGGASVMEGSINVVGFSGSFWSDPIERLGLVVVPRGVPSRRSLSDREAVELAFRRFGADQAKEAAEQMSARLGDAGLTFEIGSGAGMVLFGVGATREQTDRLKEHLIVYRDALRQTYRLSDASEPLLMVFANFVDSRTGAKLAEAVHFRPATGLDAYYEPLDHSILLLDSWGLSNVAAPTKNGFDAHVRYGAARQVNSLAPAHRELARASVRIDFPEIPRWLEEGLILAHEVSPQPIRTHTLNTYHIVYLVEARRRGILPRVDDLIDSSGDGWSDEEGLLWRSEAAHLYLHLLTGRKTEGKSLYEYVRARVQGGDELSPKELLRGFNDQPWPEVEQGFLTYLDERSRKNPIGRIFRGVLVHDLDRFDGRHVEVLDPSGTIAAYIASLTTDDRLARLQRQRDLQVLDLSRTRITDAGLVHVRGLANLKSLDLDSTHTGDPSMEHLEGLVSLERLILSNTKITDEGLKHLGKLTQLGELALSGTRVTDVGLPTLRMLRKLSRLDVRGSGVTFTAFTEQMPHFGFDDAVRAFGGTTIRDENGILTYLNFAGNPQIADPDLDLVGHQTGLKDLFLSNSRITDRGLKHLAELRGLEWLDLSGTELTDVGVLLLAGHERLAVLDLKATHISDAALSHLGPKALPALSRLNVSGTQLTRPAFLAFLKDKLNMTTDFPGGNLSLGMLSLDGVLSDDDLESLTKLGELKDLRIKSHPLTDRELTTLIKRLPKLKTLVLPDSRITDASLANISNNHVLMSVHVSKCDVTFAGVMQFLAANLDRTFSFEHGDLGFRHLWLRGKLTDDDLKEVARLKGLRDLSFGETTGLTETGLRHLEALSDLKSLDLDSLPVSGETLSRLERALPGCKIQYMVSAPPK